MRRYGSVNVPITSIGVILYGAVMALSAPTSFMALAYQRGPFVLMGHQAWGVAFVVSGVLALTVRHLMGVFPLLFVVTGWALSLMIAAATVSLVSPVAGLSWMILAVQLLVSVGIRGFRPEALPRKVGP